MNAEIGQHQQVLDTSATLEREQQRLMIGVIAATDEAVTRIEEAVTELAIRATKASLNKIMRETVNLNLDTSLAMEKECFLSDDIKIVLQRS